MKIKRYFLTIISTGSASAGSSCDFWHIDDMQKAQICIFQTKILKSSLCFKQCSTDFTMNFSGFFLKTSEIIFRARLIGGLCVRLIRWDKIISEYFPIFPNAEFPKLSVWQAHRRPLSTQDPVDSPKRIDFLQPSVVKFMTNVPLQVLYRATGTKQFDLNL